jgi:hypothetical protein
LPQSGQDTVSFKRSSSLGQKLDRSVHYTPDCRQGHC